MKIEEAKVKTHPDSLFLKELLVKEEWSIGRLPRNIYMPDVILPHEHPVIFAAAPLYTCLLTLINFINNFLII